MSQLIFNPLYLFLVLFLCSSFLLPQVVSVSLTRDFNILLQVKNTQLDDKSNALKDWVPNKDHNPCNFTGITCDARNKSVVSISLSEVGIYGDFPFGFCHIRTLLNLSLASNFLGNVISSHSLLLCSHLRVLNLSDNCFVGALPEFSSDFDQLRVLDLSKNNFTDDIPMSYGQFPQLKVLILSGNLLNGTIPSFLGNLSALTQLELAFNPLKPGSLPSQLGNLSNIEILYLAKLNLIGHIPDSIGSLVSLKHLDLSQNSLSGNIPNSISGLKNLERLYLFENQLSGELPQGLGNLSNLVGLDLSQNCLTGKLPNTIASLHLFSLNFNDNLLEGEISESLTLNPNLQQLKLFNNSVTGKLPQNLGQNSDLEDFDVSTNHFIGELPKYLCQRNKLGRLIIFDNRFSGTLPDQYGHCDSLEYVRIKNNQLCGHVASEFWRLPNLGFLEMDNNRLEGSISTSISNAKGLAALTLSGNNFSGQLPTGLCELDQLIKIDVSKNMLSEKIPACIIGLRKLQTLCMQENMLSGAIPSNVSSWTELTELNLSHNRFRGPIPPGLGDLPQLTYLDLANNSLTGEIPKELMKLKLNQFNVSSNGLCGNVPSGFNQEVYVSGIMGNPGLCSTVIKTLPSCSKHNSSSLIAVIFLTACGVVLLVSLLWFQQKKPLPTAPFKITTFQRVGFNEEDILPFLTSQNVIGTGSSGQVYRVDLEKGQMVAVKKLWVGTSKPDTESLFRSEIEMLGRIRHSNIVKLLFSCSAEDLRILAYEFMENGSLGDVLHGQKYGLFLDWSKRFNIAVGAAKGLSYLHHDCVPAIIHRDVKSNNILLDNEFRPRVADFGLAKTLNSEISEGGGAMSKVAGSYGYIAPEYAYTLKVNEKSDVYSFGVLLMELITGKRPNDTSFGENKDIVKWVTETVISYSEKESGNIREWHHCSLDKIVDPRLTLAPCDYDEVENVLNVALLCTSAFPLCRPSMRKVVELLIKDHKLAIVPNNEATFEFSSSPQVDPT